MSKECYNCIYYHEPDIEMDFKVCNFPWMDYTKEDVLLMECQDKEKMEAKGWQKD